MDDLSPQDSERLRELRAALEQEFAAHDSGDHRKTALQDIEDLKGDFLESLKHVVNHADSLALRAKVAMWGYDKLLEQGKATSDPLESLFDKLPAPARED